jgi:hypothetical protein
VALHPAVHTGDTTIYHALRWIGRLSLAMSFLVAAKGRTAAADRAELDLAA